MTAAFGEDAMKATHLVLPAIGAMVIFLAINYLAGVGLAFLVTETTRTALALGTAAPLLSLAALAALFVQFRRHGTDPQL
jgi:hypothetical protein